MWKTCNVECPFLKWKIVSLFLIFIQDYFTEPPKKIYWETWTVSLIYNFPFKKINGGGGGGRYKYIVINTVTCYQQINCLHFLVPGQHWNVIYALQLSLLKQSQGKMNLAYTLLIPLKS